VRVRGPKHERYLSAVEGFTTAEETDTEQVICLKVCESYFYTKEGWNTVGNMNTTKGIIIVQPRNWSLRVG